MSTPDIIRAWRDEEYRLSLSAEERAALPQHPAGEIELYDEDMAAGEIIITHSRLLYGFCSA